MNALIAMLIAAIPNAILAIAGKLLTEAMMQSILERVLVAGLRRAAQLSTNTVDDGIVEEIAQRLEGPKP